MTGAIELRYARRYFYTVEHTNLFLKSSGNSPLKAITKEALTLQYRNGPDDCWVDVPVVDIDDLG